MAEVAHWLFDAAAGIDAIQFTSGPLQLEVFGLLHWLLGPIWLWYTAVQATIVLLVMGIVGLHAVTYMLK